MYKVIIFYLSIFCAPFLIFAQVGISSNDSSPNICECSPSCASLIEELDCKHGQVAVREDCPCCQVCLRQEGESCGDVNSPCDGKLGLTCSNGICEASSKCKTDADCPTERICVKDTRICADPCSLQQPCLNSLKGGHCVARNHQARCECPDGMVANTEISACLENVPGSPSPPHVSSPSSLGCTVEGDFIKIGDTFYTQNCEQTCVCGQGGVLSCQPLACPTGLFPLGTFKENRFCREIVDASFDHKCCVVVECSSNFLQSVHLPSNEHRFSSSFLDRPFLQTVPERKISEANAQSISEHDFSQNFQDFDEIINGDITHLKDQTHLLRNRQAVLPIPKATGKTLKPPKTVEKKNKIDENYHSTEKTTLTTFLLQNLNENEKLPKEEITLFTQSPAFSETTTPTQFITSANNSLNTTEFSEMFATSTGETETSFSPELGSDFPVEIANQNSSLESGGMVMEIASDGKALHNVTLERKEMVGEQKTQNISTEAEVMKIKNLNNESPPHNTSKEINKIMMNITDTLELSHNDTMNKEEIMVNASNTDELLDSSAMNKEAMRTNTTDTEELPDNAAMENEEMMNTTNTDKLPDNIAITKEEIMTNATVTDQLLDNTAMNKEKIMANSTNKDEIPESAAMEKEEMVMNTTNTEEFSVNNKKEGMMINSENEEGSSHNASTLIEEPIIIEMRDENPLKNTTKEETMMENDAQIVLSIGPERGEGSTAERINDDKTFPHNTSAETEKWTNKTGSNDKHPPTVSMNEEESIKITENEEQLLHLNSTMESEGGTIIQTENDVSPSPPGVINTEEREKMAANDREFPSGNEQGGTVTEKEIGAEVPSKTTAGKEGGEMVETEKDKLFLDNTSTDKEISTTDKENGEGIMMTSVSTKKEGMINEKSDLFSELAETESFREGKQTNEGSSDPKPPMTPDKDHKTLTHHEKFSSKPGMLQVKTSTHNSTTLLLPSASGGVLHYKESRSDIEAMKLAVEEGQTEVTVTGLAPNTRYTFKWGGAGGGSGAKGKMEAKTADGCRHNGLSYAVGAKWHDGCQTTCSCHRGGASECRPRCIFVAGVIKDDQCEEIPSQDDPECCVEYRCKKKDNSVLDSPPVAAARRENAEAEPKLIVTARSHNSITVAWDDFRADNPDRRYVTEYREVPSVNITTEIPWMKKETARGQPPPTMTIGNLKPNTIYEVRVGIYNQAEERKLIAATETESVATEPGCVSGNNSYAVGEFFQGCEERCSCAKDGSVKCIERCTIPYFRKGSFANDPLCSEEQEEGDECCVLVMCAHGGSRTGGEYDQCANTVCGKNAECVSWPSLTEANEEPPQPGSCICKEGFSGDPTDHVVGCTQDATVLDNVKHCLFKGTVYSPGDEFYDGCSYKCTCNSQGELECQHRCQYPADETTLEEATGNNSCSYQPDPADPCCKIRMCNFTSDDVQTQALDFDGCTYRNKTYAKNEEFTFGCDSKCLCMGFGDVSCFPRCPPVKEMSEKESVICETLLDPLDECCDVTVCDDSAQDVMKANITIENIFNSGENNTEGAMAMDKNETLSISKSLNSNEMSEAAAMNATEVNVLSEEGNATAMDDTSMNSDKKNMSSTVEEEDIKKMMNTTSEDEMMEDPFKNATSEMDFMNNTETLIPIENDMMFKHENGTQEKDAMHIDTSTLLTTNETSENDTESSTNPGMIMKEEMEKKMMVSETDNETEATTVFTDVEEKMHDRTTSHLSEANFPRKKARFEDFSFPQIEIIKIRPTDSSTVEITAKTTQDIIESLLSSDSEFLTVSYSPDSLKWTNRTIPVGYIGIENQDEIIFPVTNLEANDAFQFKIYYKNIVSPTEKASLSDVPIVASVPVLLQEGMMCEFGGKQYSSGQNFYDGCVHYCQCNEDAIVHCEKIQCPERFGLDIVDSGCIEWEDDPNHEAVPPRCCGKMPKCTLHLNDLACHHMGQKFHHYDLIPKELIGCDQQCQCLNGSLSCESLCNPVQATPPFHLACDSQDARLVTAATFPCCREWQCLNGTISDFPHDHIDYHHFADGFKLPEITFVDIMDITESSVRIEFAIADKLVGLPGGIFLRFAKEHTGDLVHLPWESEVIHEEGVIMDRSKWEYTKSGLEPDTEYAMQLALFTLHKRTETVSERFFVRTLPEVTTPLPRLDLDAELEVSEIKNTSAKISWKHFNEHELQYIDGIRVRYWPGTKKFPLEGPMLHREADSMTLRDLLPDTKYTVDLFFIKHKGLMSPISNTKITTFTTLPKPKDKYDFNITIEAGEMTKEGVHILYSGIPEPEGKYINVYRVVYTTDSDSWDSQKFKVPKNQKEGFITLTDLKPGVQYEVWLEAYLTNGIKKKSNVITIETKPGELPTPEKSEIVEASTTDPESEGNYYSAFVAVVILVVLACLIIFGLLLVLFRRQSHAKAHINSTKGNAAYDNPSYKTSEHQSYNMELHGLKNTTNGASRNEEQP